MIPAPIGWLGIVRLGLVQASLGAIVVLTTSTLNRVMVVEVMGRHTGWIAVVSGIAGGADVILIPEQPLTVEEACTEIELRHARGKDFSIVVVSEGYELRYETGEARTVAQEERDQFGHVRLGGVGEVLAREIEERTRRRDVVVDDTAVHAFYDVRVPADVVSARHFDAWWKQARHETPDLLTMTRADVMTGSGGGPAVEQFPDSL